MFLILNKPFPDYQIKATFPWQTWALYKPSQDCSIWLNPAQIKAKLSLHKLSLEGAGCSCCREKDGAGNCRQRMRNAKGSSRSQRRGGKVLCCTRGCCISLQREFGKQSHCGSVPATAVGCSWGYPGSPMETLWNTACTHQCTAQPPQRGSLLAEALAKAIVLTPFFNIYFRMSLTGGRVEGTPNLIP